MPALLSRIIFFDTRLLGIHRGCFQSHLVKSKLDITATTPANWPAVVVASIMPGLCVKYLRTAQDRLVFPRALY
jgi:hypothetical protein